MSQTVAFVRRAGKSVFNTLNLKKNLHIEKFALLVSSGYLQLFCPYILAVEYNLSRNINNNN